MRRGRKGKGKYTSSGNTKSNMEAFVWVEDSSLLEKDGHELEDWNDFGICYI